MEIKNRLDALRALMAENGIDAAIIPQTDPHQSEYISSHWQVRRYFTGFTGSAGDLVVTADKALLWTDSRYFLQAAAQLDGTGIILMKDGLPETPSIAAWLSDNLDADRTVGIDGMVFSYSVVEDLINTLASKDILVNTEFNPAAAWADRPALPQNKILIHDIKYAGRAAHDKIADILADAHKAHNADAVFLSALDEIAWALNIRARDVNCNPVATSFLYLSDKGSTLFIDPAKLTPETESYLKAEGVATAPYDGVAAFISRLNRDTAVLVQPQRNAAGLIRLLGHRAVFGTPAAAMLKACKNDVQIAGVREAMKRDGAALVRAFIRIEKQFGEGTLTELEVCRILHEERAKDPLFFDESFETIAGFGPHGAIVHYEPDEASNAAVNSPNLLLVDSGAQYLDGTTDITRTVCTGTPTAAQKTDFTLVMQGHIALGSQAFPYGTTGHQLDALARQFLWQRGLSYLHGTGHGVGHFLNVHEGPQSIRLNHVPTPLTPGMITSNEPGLYRENIHGIRCENLVLTVEAPDLSSDEFGRFLRFETLTLFPFERDLFDTAIMSAAEIEWLNAYHAHVRESLMPLMENDEQRQWLSDHTLPL